MTEIVALVVGSVLVFGGLGAAFFTKRPQQVSYQEKLSKNVKTNREFDWEHLDASQYYSILLSWKPLFESNDQLLTQYEELLAGVNCLVEAEKDPANYQKVEHFCDRYIKGLIEQLTKYKSTINDSTTESLSEYIKNLNLAILDIMKDINQMRSLDITSSLKAYSLMLKVNHNIDDPFKK